ncbi:SDR family oxidoreductase [Rhodococcus sp. GXMU-t2271]|uniref:SDR family oxidoreductase n=1 Tax=Rhodococcus sp. GXMU-t2271 TaxID=3059079 RepID=UPI00352AB5BB
MSGRLSGRSALIAGGARGIGRTQAVRFAEEGADLIVLDCCAGGSTTPEVSRADLAETVRQIEALGRRAFAVDVDVRDQKALDAALAQGVASLGRLDIVCTTTEIGSAGNIVELPSVVWQTMLDVHLTGVWKTCKAAIPHMLASDGVGGSIVLTGSDAGLRGTAGGGHRAAAEHGVVGLMRTLAKELAPKDIRVNTVHRSNASHDLTHDPDAIPGRREIANASLFLASDEARGITGVVLPVDVGHCRNNALPADESIGIRRQLQLSTRQLHKDGSG